MSESKNKEIPVLIKWEKLDRFTSRLRVPGGWIVQHFSKSVIINNESGPKQVALSEGMVFYPDPEHGWIAGRDADKD